MKNKKSLSPALPERGGRRTMSEERRIVVQTESRGKCFHLNYAEVQPTIDEVNKEWLTPY